MYTLTRYSTTATKVNVRKLKTDIWTKISNTLSHEDNTENFVPSSHVNVIPDDDDDVDEYSTESKKPVPTGAEKLSFQALISSLAGEQRQGDVSLPYYFICLLHLANEKVR
jgi:hypothetical protein